MDSFNFALLLVLAREIVLHKYKTCEKWFLSIYFYMAVFSNGELSKLKLFKKGEDLKDMHSNQINNVNHHIVTVTRCVASYT